MRIWVANGSFIIVKYAEKKRQTHTNSWFALRLSLLFYGFTLNAIKSFISRRMSAFVTFSISHLPPVADLVL